MSSSLDQDVEQGFRLTIDSIPGLVNVLTAAGEIEFTNRQLLTYFGKTIEELRDWETADVVHPDDLPGVISAWRRSVETGEPLDIQHRLRRADGVYRWFHGRALPLRDTDDRILRWYSLLTDVDDWKRAEDALHASERDFRLILDSIPGLVATNTPTGETELVNRQMLEYFGRTLEEIKGWRTLDAVHPDDLKRVVGTIEAWMHAPDASGPFEFDLRLRRADGIYRWFHLRAFPARNANRSVARWYHLLVDIDERKQAEEKLQRTEAFLLEAQRLSHTGGWRHDLASGTVTTWPEASSEMHQAFGAGRDDDTSAPEFWFSRIHPEDRQRVVDTFSRCESEKTDYRADYRIVLPDGTIKYQRSVGHPILNESGDLVEFVGTAMDTTEQSLARLELERANLALQAGERDLRLIFDSIPGMVFTMNADGQHELISQQLLDFHGKTCEELQDWRHVIHPDDRERLVALKSRTIDLGLPYEVEHRRLRADGVYRWFNARGVPARDDEGRVVRWYSLLTDIEDRTNAEEALRLTQTRLSRAIQNATVGELGASIAHEVNQPLAAVVANGHACLRWLSAEPPNLVKAVEAVERIVRDGKDAGEVVRRVRALFKRAAVEKIALDVNDVIQEVLRLLDAETTRKGAIVEVDLESDLPPVLGDRVQLQQLVLNLLLNGLEAMDLIRDRPRKLVVRSKRRGEDALIEIRDHGVGLTDPDRAFEAFFTTKDNGMGMGLAICRSIIAAHDGQLWASTDAEPGTTFSFTLPLRSSSAQF